MSSSFGDYRTIPYLKEHYLVAQMIFEKHGDRIPQVNKLKQQVSRAFGERAMTLAYNALSNEDFFFGRTCFIEALKMFPKSYNNILFLKCAVVLIVGPKCLKFYRLLK
jgi:hypothetical protein